MKTLVQFILACLFTFLVAGLSAVEEGKKIEALLIFHKQPLIKDSYRYIQTEQQLNSTSQDDNALYMWRMKCNILPVIQYYILSRRIRCFGLKYNSYILINWYNTVHWWQMSGTQSVWKNKNIYIYAGPSQIRMSWISSFISVIQLKLRNLCIK